MNFRKKVSFLLPLLIAFCVSSCQLFKSEKPQQANTSEGYYSIKGFLNDQWHLLHGEPIVLLQVSSFNGTTDSAYVRLDSTLWKNICKQFDPSDISDPKFVNQYQFSTFSDNSLNLIYMNYEAENEGLFTRNLNIGIDNLTHKIKSIFIETEQGNHTYEKSQKLTYIPHNLIRIQTFEKSIISKPENLTVSYFFNFK